MGYTLHWNQLTFSDFTWSNVVKLVPKVVKCKFTQTEWGFILGDSDDDSSCIERNNPRQLAFSKTNRLPYTKDFMKALILMVEFGAAQDLDHDDDDMSMWLSALEEVYAFHLLVSYEQQKAYFSSM